MLGYPGKYVRDATFAEQRARDAGIPAARARCIGVMASYWDCFAFQKYIAEAAGSSVSTVQRARRQGADLGVLECYRCKPGEKHPLLKKVLRSKGGRLVRWCHRFTVGREMSGAAKHAAVALARYKRQQREQKRKEQRAASETELQQRWGESKLVARALRDTPELIAHCKSQAEAVAVLRARARDGPPDHN